MKNYIRKFDYFDSSRMQDVFFIVTWHETYKRWIPLVYRYDERERDSLFKCLQKYPGTWIGLYSIGVAWNGRWSDHRIEGLDALPPPDDMFDAKAE